ncbi:MAG: class I SAM-dependent methyltransferase [Pedosphaera sp.]|nr:class I SAM-dependent methyltransferase [Pedosphaera sp.]
MPRIPTHPLAEHPLDRLPGKPECSLPLSNRTYLTAVMLENSLRQSMPYVKGRLLDVGCGQRPYEKTFFAGATEYIGCDYLSDRSRPDVVCSATELTFPDNSFDTVVSTEVLEHVPEPQRAINEMHRVLKPGGHLILSTPMYWPRHEVPYDFFRYPYDGLIHLVNTSGLELVRIFNRGRSYSMVGQVLQHTNPFRARFVSWLINRFFLWCDRRLKQDTITLGWTVIASKPATRGEKKS